MGILIGKTCLVVGAGRRGNMGDGIVRRLLSEGARVAASARSAEYLALLQRELQIETFRCDMTQESSVQALAQHSDNALGPLDALIVTAGVTAAIAIAEATRESMDELMLANFYGPVFLLKHFAPRIRAGGSVLLISSSGALRHNNTPTRAIYNSSKAALERLVSAAAVELGPQQIRVNALAPGLVLTPMGDTALRDFGPKLTARLTGRTPMQRLATTADIGAMAAIIISDAYFDTGQVLQANGGFSLQCGSPLGSSD